MSNLTPERLEQIEKAAKATQKVLGDAWLAARWFEEYFGESTSRHLANMDPATTLTLIKRVRELEVPKCAHCGYPVRGHAFSGDDTLCHPNMGMDCYVLVTVNGHPTDHPGRCRVCLPGLYGGRQ